MPSIFERIQARIELFRLEQRYTRRRHRRSTFVSNAVYVDGEYIYNTPNMTGSSGYTSSSNGGGDAAGANDDSNNNGNDVFDAAQAEAEQQQREAAAAKKQTKRLNRWSSMPGFGSMGRSAGQGMPAHVEEEEWRTRRNSAEATR